MRLNRKFFNRNTVIIARELLGKYLCRRINSSTSSGQVARIIRVKITETEAYCGSKDLASHASKGLTLRTKLMFGPPGYAYIYMIYGMYYCLNVVTEKEGYPAAVLIRAVDLENGRGPGRLCRELKIDRKLNGADLATSKELWIESGGWRRGEETNRSKINKGKRIGIDYAGEYRHKLWRFYYS